MVVGFNVGLVYALEGGGGALDGGRLQGGRLQGGVVSSDSTCLCDGLRSSNNVHIEQREND